MLDPQMKRGLLDICVLSVLCRGDSHGYQIIKDLSGYIAVSESTLYPILRRLETAGALTVYTVEYNSRLRKIYHLTTKGRQQIQEFIDSWGEMIQVYNFIKGGLEIDEG